MTLHLAATATTAYPAQMFLVALVSLMGNWLALICHPWAVPGRVPARWIAASEICRR